MTASRPADAGETGGAGALGPERTASPSAPGMEHVPACAGRIRRVAKFDNCNSESNASKTFCRH